MKLLTKADRVKIHVALSYLKMRYEKREGLAHEIPDIDRLLDYFYDYVPKGTSYEKVNKSTSGDWHDRQQIGLR